MHLMIHRKQLTMQIKSSLTFLIIFFFFILYNKGIFSNRNKYVNVTIIV